MKRERETPWLRYYGAIWGGMERLKTELRKMLQKDEHIDKLVGEMQRTVLLDSESIVRMVISGLIQGEEMK